VKVNAMQYMASLLGFPNSSSQMNGNIKLEYIKGLPSWNYNLSKVSKKIPRQRTKLK